MGAGRGWTVCANVRAKVADCRQWESQTDESMQLVDSIEMNTKHYVEIMSRAIDNVMPQPSEEVKYG